MGTCNRVLHFAYLNSFYQTGLKNLIDKAVIKHTEEIQNLIHPFSKTR